MSENPSMEKSLDEKTFHLTLFLTFLKQVRSVRLG